MDEDPAERWKRREVEDGQPDVRMVALSLADHAHLWAGPSLQARQLPVISVKHRRG